jgi:aldose 1-epimerase
VVLRGRSRLELACAGANALVSPEDGGRLASLVIDGRERLVTGTSDDDPMRWGCYPMAPWAGRVRRGRLVFRGYEHLLPIDAPPHAIHGTVYRRAWAVEADGTLVTDLGPAWPFGGLARQRFDLEPGRLQATLEVHADLEPMPVTAGFHPWFVRPVELDAAPTEMYERDDEGIPTGRLVPPAPLPWDDCFVGLAGPPRLTFDDGLTITVTSDADHWVLFTPPHAICVEPQTGPPDGPNIEPFVVEPARPLAVTMTLTWEPAR